MKLFLLFLASHRFCWFSEGWRGKKNKLLDEMAIFVKSKVADVNRNVIKKKYDNICRTLQQVNIISLNNNCLMLRFAH